MSSASFNKVLVINPFGIGDAIFSMYLAEAVKGCLPQTQVDFLGNERTIKLLRMNSSIDACHKFNRDEFRALRRRDPFGFVSKVFRFTGEIKKERYDAVFDLSLGREFSFVAACLGIRRRVGFNFKGRGLWLTHRMELEGYEKKHVVDWQVGLLRALGLEPPKLSARLPLTVPASAKKEASELLAAQGLGPAAVLTAAAPGGGKSWGPNAVYKQWAPERFAEALRQGARPGAVLLLGDTEEKPLLEKVRKLLTGPVVVAAGLDIPVACALLQQSRVLLCNDGGLLHLANALGVPTVSVYGPVDEKVYGPYGGDIRHEVLTEKVPCRPCYHRFHFPPCAHERRCLEELSVEKVSAALGKI